MPSAPQPSPIPSKLQKLLVKLRQKKYRHLFGQYLAEGVKTVQDSLRFGARPHFFVFRQGEALPAWASAAPQYMVAPHAFAKLSALESPSGVMAVFSMNNATEPSGLHKAGRILVLDGVSDPGNLGTLMRTAHWFGFRHVVLCGSAADPFNPKAVQAAMGSLPAMQLYFLQSEEVVAHFKNGKVAVFPAVLEGGKPFTTPDLPVQKPYALVLGSEAHGLSDIWLQEDFHRIFIPPSDPQPPDSLNVSLAGAILMQHLAQ